MIDRKKLYKLPFSKFNNANGWIEPTTFCQLKCRYCYRLSEAGEHASDHRRYEDLAREVDDLIKKRNIQTLSIAGGEPLLYPYLDDLVIYAKSKKLKVVIFTNGILLDRTRLKKLKSIGTDRVMLHISKYQERADSAKENFNLLKENFCSLFREIKGIGLGFVIPVDPNNEDDLKEQILFYKNNADIIESATITFITEELQAGKKLDNDKINSDKVFQKIQDFYGLEFNSYLGKIYSDEISWLFSYNIFANNKYLGSLDKDAVEYLQKKHYQIKKKYFYMYESPLLLSGILLNKSVRQIIKNYISQKKIVALRAQLIIVISPPRLTQLGWNLCDGCVDSMFHKGEIVPSCLLERIKNGEDIHLPENK